MKKAVWLASVVGLAVAAWATLASVPVQADAGSYAAEESADNGDLARHRHGSSGGYSSHGGRRHRHSSYGSAGGRRRRGHGSYGSHG